MTNFPSDHPFAIWRVFHDAPRWWFARGCPPTVRALSGWARVLHLTVLIAAMGLLAAIVGACVMGLVRPLPPWDAVLFGGVFSAIVLVPLSRWLDRPWWWAVLSVPYLIAWFNYAESINRHWVYSNGPPGLPHALWMVLATFLIAAGPGVWVISWRRPRTWWVLAGVLGACVAATSVNQIQLQMSGWWLMMGSLSPVVDYVITLQPLVVFLTLTAVSLGVPLWRDDAQVTAPFPAANTAATGTEKPSSSADVAVSPDWNSP
jgi:hypothetical protein